MLVGGLAAALNVVAGVVAVRERRVCFQHAVLRREPREAQRARRVLRHRVRQKAGGGEGSEPERSAAHEQRRPVRAALPPSRGAAEERLYNVSQLARGVDVVIGLVRVQQIHSAVNPVHSGGRVLN